MDFTPAELDILAQQLAEIVDFIDQLNELPSETASVIAEGETPLRADEAIGAAALLETERNAPQFQVGYFVVPRVVTAGD